MCIRKLIVRRRLSCILFPGPRPSGVDRKGSHGWHNASPWCSQPCSAIVLVAPLVFIKYQANPSPHQWQGRVLAIGDRRVEGVLLRNHWTSIGGRTEPSSARSSRHIGLSLLPLCASRGLHWLCPPISCCVGRPTRLPRVLESLSPKYPTTTCTRQFGACRNMVWSGVPVYKMSYMCASNFNVILLGLVFAVMLW